MTEIATPETSATAPATETPALDFNTYVTALPETHRDLLKKNGVDSFEKQEKWVSGLNSLIGKKGIIPPDESASDEDKAKYRDTLMKELGRPDAGEYEFVLPEGSKGDYYTDDFMNGLADIAYKSGMSNQAFQDVVNYIASSFNNVVGEWDKTISEINKKLGEDKIADNSTASTSSKADIHQEAKAKRIQAEELYRKGDFKGAQMLKSQADELYAKL
jgi:hypothetical protein